MLSVSPSGAVKLTRGDTARLSVNITNETVEKTYEVGASDVLTLTIKKTIRDEVPAVQKSITGDNQFHIAPDDTSGLEFGKYKYDVQLTTAAGDVYTVCGPSDFEIMQEVTY